MYQPALRTSPVMAQPLAGGPPDTLIACVIGTAVAVNDSGIYYVPCSAIFAPGQTTAMRVLDPRTGKDREVGRLDQYHVGLLTGGLRRLPRWQNHPVQPGPSTPGPSLHDDRELPVGATIGPSSQKWLALLFRSLQRRRESLRVPEQGRCTPRRRCGAVAQGVGSHTAGATEKIRKNHVCPRW